MSCVGSGHLRPWKPEENGQGFCGFHLLTDSQACLESRLCQERGLGAAALKDFGFQDRAPVSFGVCGGRKCQSSPVRAWAPGPLRPAAPQVCQVRGVKHQSLEVGRDGASG